MSNTWAHANFAHRLRPVEVECLEGRIRLYHCVGDPQSRCHVVQWVCLFCDGRFRRRLSEHLMMNKVLSSGLIVPCRCPETVEWRAEFAEREQARLAVEEKAAEQQREAERVQREAERVQWLAEREEQQRLARERAAHIDALHHAPLTPLSELAPWEVEFDPTPGFATNGQNYANREGYAELCANWWRYRRGAEGADHTESQLRLAGETWEQAATRLAYGEWRVDAAHLPYLDSYWHTGPVANTWRTRVETWLRNEPPPAPAPVKRNPLNPVGRNTTGKRRLARGLRNLDMDD